VKWRLRVATVLLTRKFGEETMSESESYRIFLLDPSQLVAIPFLAYKKFHNI
jgi:hypothetical protein